MDIRKQLGGFAEDYLNKAVDEALAGEGDLFEDLGKKIAEELKAKLGTNLAERIKANWIDKLDGEDDIPDVE